MFYALSHIEEFYLKDNLIKFIALAPCSISTGITKDDGTPDVEWYDENEFKLHDLGIYDVAGPHWDENIKKGCEALGKEWCDTAKAYDGQPFGTQDTWHWDYNFVQQRFQEFAPKYQEGEVITPLIPIESIDKVPIALISGTEDPTCPYKTAKHMLAVIPAVKSFQTM